LVSKKLFRLIVRISAKHTADSIGYDYVPDPEAVIKALPHVEDDQLEMIVDSYISAVSFLCLFSRVARTSS